MTETSFAEQIAKDAQLNAEARAPFAAAMGVSESVVNASAESNTVASKDKLNLEIAKRQVEQSGAGATGVELASKAIDAIGGTLDKFASWFKQRGEGRKAKASNQEQTISKILAEKESRAKSAEQQKILDAQAKEFNPDFSVNRGVWAETGGKAVDVVKSGAQEVKMKWSEFRAKINESDAQKFLNRANDWSESAAFLHDTANGLLNKQYERQAVRGQKGYEGFKEARVATNTSEERAKAAQDALDQVRQEKYFMPDAMALGQAIKVNGGDQGFTKTAEAAKDWAGRAAGTSSTS